MSIAARPGRLTGLAVALGIGAAVNMLCNCADVWAAPSGSTTSSSNPSPSNPSPPSPPTPKVAKRSAPIAPTPKLSDIAKPLSVVHSNHLLASPVAPTTVAPTTATNTPSKPKLIPLANKVSTAVATTPVAALTAPTVKSAAVSAAVSTPAPVSPIVTLFSLPAHIADAVLGLLGITPATATTPTPISPAPIVQLIFAAFREFENAAGLDSPPAVQPTNTETFTGSVTTPTPTVAQLLDAATAEYVLGGTPAGLTPFTVNGFPVSSTDELTGETAQVWVTPQKQIIIAYSGTTGGTNLLFNPLIGVTQVLVDAVAVLTRTNPAGSADALQFAQQVETEAAAQGYTPNDIFVTGHSLGAWEAEYVAQNTGLGGIGFESLGLATTVPGNGADSLFVNTATYGDPASFSSDLPGLQPFAPPYVPGGGLYPHYGSIVLLGAPSSETPLANAAQLWGTGIIGDLVFLVVGLGQLFEYHLPSDQAYNLDVDLQPGLLPGSGVYSGPVETGFGDLTIPEFLQAASNDGILINP